jgi:hypothetical protein
MDQKINRYYYQFSRYSPLNENRNAGSTIFKVQNFHFWTKQFFTAESAPADR